MGERRWKAPVLAVAVLFAGTALRPRATHAEDDGAATSPCRATLERDVRVLADPGLHGRREWADRERVATYVADRMKAIGLLPVPGAKGFAHDFGGPEPEPRFRNVAGWLPGARAGKTAAEAGDYVVVTANYDYVGMQGETVYPGADTGASGVAGLLEVAARLVKEAKGGKPSVRSLLFVATDGKEQALRGSRELAEGRPLSLAGCKAMVCLEMLGRAMGDLIPGTWLVLGTEHSAALETITRDLKAPTGGRMLHIGAYFHAVDGDYLPFRDKQIPFVYATAGESCDWMRPTDVPEGIRWDWMCERVEWIASLLRALATVEEAPAWRPEGPPRIEEMQELRELVHEAADIISTLKPPPTVLAMIASFRKRLDAIVESGVVTEAQRTGVRNTMVAMSRFAVLIKR